MDNGLARTAKYFVPRLLGTFCKRYPEIDVSLEVLNRDGVVARLRNNLDDLYVMSVPPQDLDLVDDVFMANPLAKRKSLSLAELTGQRFILREEGSGTRMAVDHCFKKLKFRPDLRLELGSNEAIKESVGKKLSPIASIFKAHLLAGASGPRDSRPLDQEGAKVVHVGQGRPGDHRVAQR